MTMRVTITLEGNDSTATFEEHIRHSLAVSLVHPNREMAKLLEKVVEQARSYMEKKP